MARFILLLIVSTLLFVGAFKLEQELMSLIGGKGILEVISDWLEEVVEECKNVVDQLIEIE